MPGRQQGRTLLQSQREPMWAVLIALLEQPPGTVLPCCEPFRVCLQVRSALAERQPGRWLQHSQQEPFQASVMSHPGQLPAVAPLGAAQPSQVCCHLFQHVCSHTR